MTAQLVDTIIVTGAMICIGIIGFAVSAVIDLVRAKKLQKMSDQNRRAFNLGNVTDPENL